MSKRETAFNEYVTDILSLMESYEDYHSEVGKKMVKLTKEFGRGSVKKLADRINNLRKRNGQKLVSFKTLQNYSWVEQKTGHFNLPSYITFSVRQKIASNPNPEYWAEKVVKDKMSLEEVIKTMEMEK